MLFRSWYERNPLHTLVLYVTHRSILFQIGLSVLTVLLLFKINHIAGWLYCFYPQSIIYSNMFTKVTLTLFLFVLAMYLFKNKKWLIIASFIAIQLSTMSLFHLGSGSQGMTEEFSVGYWLKAFHLWQPTFNHTPAIFGNIIQYIQMPFYILLMFLFFRTTEINYAWVIVFILTIGSMLMYGHAYMREFILPVILINVLEHRRPFGFKFAEWIDKCLLR